MPRQAIWPLCLLIGGVVGELACDLTSLGKGLDVFHALRTKTLYLHPLDVLPQVFFSTLCLDAVET